MGKDKGILGPISALCTMGLLVLIGWKAGAFGMVTDELVLFLSGRFREVASNHTTFLMMFPVMLAVVVLELPCTIGAGIFQSMLLGESGKHAVTNLLDRLKEGNHFFAFFAVVLIEELFARWFFLGFLTQISFLSGTVAFYALFLIGNGIWALVHLSNFEEKKDRKVLRVLPQFVSGIFFTYVFVKYGLLATILTHFASNAVLFALHKVQRVSLIDALIICYAALCAAISYALMERPLTDILPWFADSPVFRLGGWKFWDYVKVSVCFSSAFTVAFGLLLYDRGTAGKGKPEKKVTPLQYISGLLIVLPIVIGILYGVYSLLGLFIESVPYRILVLAILFTFLQRGASGSAIARTFWKGLPDTYVTMCILQALGFWPAFAWILIEVAVSAPVAILNKFDD